MNRRTSLVVAVCMLALAVLAGVLVVRAASIASTTGGPDAVALPTDALAPGVLAYTEQASAPAVAAPSGLDRTIEVIDRRPGAETYGTVVSVRPDGTRVPTGIECDRFHERNGVAACLRTEGVIAEASDLALFDRRDDVLVERGVQRFMGTPSRVRLSDDAVRLGFTTFVAGHGYAEPGSLSTFTALLEDGVSLRHMEMLTVTERGRNLDDPSNNFWGATFGGSDDMFVTMAAASGATAHEFHVVAVDDDALTGEVIGAGECPSLSPDGRTLVVKDRVVTGGTTVGWRLVAIDLASGARTVLPEARSVDDQVEWFDDHTILYGVAAGGTAAEPRTDVYALRVDDPEARPMLVVAGADSPSAPDR